MLNKEEIEEYKNTLEELASDENVYNSIKRAVTGIFEYIQQLESNNQKLIEKLEERIKSINKCYEDLIKPYYDKELDIINTSYMSKEEKEEFINKTNCLIVQKASFEEILEIVKGEK